MLHPETDWYEILCYVRILLKDMPMLVMTSLADFFLAFSESRRVEAEGKDPSNPRYNVKLVLENKKEIQTQSKIGQLKSESDF